jgi:beta-1,4-mannosyl-glycoprotein beta-1,4-N-acetylglucosaminyltransferase
MIIDAFLYNDEADALEIRLHTLWRHVDYFLIVEANRTFSGQVRPLLQFSDFWAEYPHYIINKVRIATVDLTNVSVDPQNLWPREYLLRNHIRASLRTIFNPHIDDWIIISDVDEIPDPEVWKTGPCQHVQFPYLYYGYANYFCHRAERGPIMTQWDTVEAFPTQQIRAEYAVRNPERMFRGGWHFSFMGGVEAWRRKLGNTCHTEVIADPFIEKLERKIDPVSDKMMIKIDGCGLGNLVRGGWWPPYLYYNQARFARLMGE